VTSVRATCEGCGDVELPIGRLSVRLCVETGAATYGFQCPECDQRVVTPTEQAVADLLVASGAPLVVWTLPAELFETHVGPAIDHDDVLDFHLLLQRPGWFDDVVALPPTISS
jgi:hypothetical protein